MYIINCQEGTARVPITERGKLMATTKFNMTQLEALEALKKILNGEDVDNISDVEQVLDHMIAAKKKTSKRVEGPSKAYIQNSNIAKKLIQTIKNKGFEKIDSKSIRDIADFDMTTQKATAILRVMAIEGMIKLEADKVNGRAVYTVL